MKPETALSILVSLLNRLTLGPAEGFAAQSAVEALQKVMESAKTPPEAKP